MTSEIALSPVDSRYHLPELDRYLGSQAYYSYLCKIEEAHLELLAKEHGIPWTGLRLAESEIRATALEIEQVNGHEVAALAEAIRRNTPTELQSLVHAGLTASDVQDTANAARIKDALRDVTIPAAVQLGMKLLDFAGQGIGLQQVGRTHGQHAEPVDAGYALLYRVSRYCQRLVNLNDVAGKLVGKVSGSVGNYNALGRVVADPIKHEADLLGRFGLQRPAASSQIVPPEPLLDVLHAITSTWGVLADLADEFRNLTRYEIGELTLSDSRTGSSSMPGKTNPIDFENVKASWKAFMPRMTTAYMDQVSEHQRDLTNSLTMRFVPETVAMFTYAVKRFDSSLAKVSWSKVRIAGNLAGSLKPLRGQDQALSQKLGMAPLQGDWAAEYTRHGRVRARALIHECKDLLQKTDIAHSS